MSIDVHIVDGALRASMALPPQNLCGALVCFEGRVRPDEEGREIQGLDYQTYDPMAEMELRRLALEAMNRFGAKAFSVEHSRGFVAVGEVSFRLRIASAHRKESLAAVEWFIDQMKSDVPIWKSPVFAGERETVR